MINNYSFIANLTFARLTGRTGKDDGLWQAETLLNTTVNEG